MVFIDAGHGGKDPGAIGKAGTHEKNITLAAAQELARQLTKTGKVIPILARNDDRFLRLRQRISMARQTKQIYLFRCMLTQRTHQQRMVFRCLLYRIRLLDKEAAILARNENNADLIGVA